MCATRWNGVVVIFSDPCAISFSRTVRLLTTKSAASDDDDDDDEFCRLGLEPKYE